MFTKDERTNARIVALQKLFAADIVQRIDAKTKLPRFKSPYDKVKTAQLVKSVLAHQSFIDELIRKYAPQRPLEDMNPVDVILIRLGFVEAFILKQAPVKVCINEAVELAKRFSGDTSYRLVNGVLGAIFEHEVDKIEEYAQDNG